MSERKKNDRKTRRQFLSATSRTLALAAGAGFASKALGQTGTLIGTPDQLGEKIRLFPFNELDSFLTPLDKFFLRSHLEIPRLNPEQFRVQVGGLVERPYSLGLADLQRMPQVSHAVAFECSGSSVGGGMISNAKWTGPLLWPLIERARPKEGAKELVMEGADTGLDEFVPVPLQYARGVTLSVLEKMPALLAISMNDRPLRDVHGFPARVILPGQYGVQHVKWVIRLTVIDRRFLGFYQTQRYVGWRQTQAGIRVEEIERQRVKSQIARVEPKPGAEKGIYHAVGAAWAGGEGIQGVDVSVDGGASWTPAKLKEPRGDYSWALWSHEWAPAPGTHEVLARATDGRGRSQPLSRNPQILTGYINNWCHRKTVIVPA